MNSRKQVSGRNGAYLADLQLRGYTIVRGATSRTQLDELLRQLAPQLSPPVADDKEVRRFTLQSRGVVVAARHVLDRSPQVAELWKSPPLVRLLLNVLGPRCGLVRALFFDKPPERTWGLPWHRDRTIAVCEHLPELGPFSKPTVKASVPHLEAPVEILQQMLTLRLHFDDADAENGALQVIPGSHSSECESVDIASKGSPEIVSIDLRAGDCLAMRPLISHASGPSRAGTLRHRRVLHLEFAAEERLPAGYRWREFHRMC